ncbi:MAG: hypothetical protein IT223_05450 [Crocinitomicaceae bacterium]|nr:hypothetical protein [Crocinitomicaceae bacterium]
MKLIFTLIFSWHCFLLFAQSPAQVFFPEGTNFHKVANGFVTVSFDLKEKLSATQLSGVRNWVEHNQPNVIFDLEYPRVTASLKAEVNSAHAWGKLFAIMGVNVFEIEDSGEKKVTDTEGLFTHFAL